MFDEQENQVIEQNIEQQEMPEQNIEIEKPQETAQQKNFRELRNKLDRLQRERDEAIHYIKDIEAKANANNNIPVVDDEDFNLDPDAIAEGKHISKVANKVKKLEQQLTEARLKAKYQDFDKIVSQDNVEALRQSHPEIWATINSTSDLYNKAVSAYTLIKELGISRNDSYDQDKMLIQQNAAKPKPFAAVSSQQGDSPLSKANAFAGGLTDQLKGQLIKEMVEAMKNR